ncbi:hypothetical protein Tco_0817333 [Tanacetum coccineum]
MFNDVKLQVDYECEMAFKLLRLVKKQLKEGLWEDCLVIQLLMNVTAAKLMLMVYKLLLMVLKVNALSTKVTTAQRLRLLKEFLLQDHVAKVSHSTTILPPNFHLQVGRPQKKRKKFGGESILMVNNGKLSRRANTMTCVLCKSKGNNKRSCKGPTANAGKKRTKAETFVGTSDIDKKVKKNDGGVNTRSFETTKEGKQATATDKAKKNAKKGKSKCRLKFLLSC